ncbi:RIP metalloprotease RseP [Helicobacter bizzozeronii]|uniref:RIP metalloprotease RseP n=1 Tax=Helicobacter bizzozeronii TaxID=56877 RepID=UPI000CEF0DE0|nr:RIP metalloprotease RseP [Helicobacter bizzozeronii]GMB93659.1 RIP metalloprotease RseP [Helicobacter bizzozeronii]
MSLLFSVLALGFLIFFHELGHFLVARACGVHVEVFSIGFGRKIWAKTHGKTQYALSLIPLGGYVKLKGQDFENPSLEPDSYNSKTPLQKIAILMAGPLFNLLLAFGIYSSLNLIGQKSLAPIVGSVIPNMPAAQAGLQAQDRILAINDNLIVDWQALTKAIQKSQGTLQVTLKRGAQTLTLPITPTTQERTNVFHERILTKAIGIAPAKAFVVLHYGVLEAFEHAGAQLLSMVSLVLQGLEKLIVGVVGVSELSSVVGIVDFMAHQSDWSVLLLSVAFISINLGILNLLPIPMLDGGQILFVLYESLARKKIGLKSIQAFNIVGLGILITLMAIGLFNDLSRLWHA